SHRSTACQQLLSQDGRGYCCFSYGSVTRPGNSARLFAARSEDTPGPSGDIARTSVIIRQCGMEFTLMAGAFRRKSAVLSVAAFRGWVESRPDEEHWELINGVPVLKALATRDHQRIASNLERLLNDAIERMPQRIPPMAAYQRIGVNLGPAVKD